MIEFLAGAAIGAIACKALRPASNSSVTTVSPPSVPTVVPAASPPEPRVKNEGPRMLTQDELDAIGNPAKQLYLRGSTPWPRRQA